jgi:hypothetical protein
VLAFGIIENGPTWLISIKNEGCLTNDHRPKALTPHPHMFPCHRSHSLNSSVDHFLVKNQYVLAFDIIENSHSWLFSTNMGVVWYFIMDQRLVHLTPHMFPYHRSHYWISGGYHFLVKKS